MANDGGRGSVPIENDRTVDLAVSLMFAPGMRPDKTALAAQSAREGGFAVGPAAAEGDWRNTIGERNCDSGDGPLWLELATSGLTFDLCGLAPGPACEMPDGGMAAGLAGTHHTDDGRLEAMTLAPGPHLQGGTRMIPVIRCLALLASQLASLSGLRAVAWHPARGWTSPQQFRAGVLRWAEGGAFPGLALATLRPAPGGGMETAGLALFTGQELHLHPSLATDGEAASIALDLMHWLVGRGGLAEPERIGRASAPDLLLEPAADGTVLVSPVGQSSVAARV